MKNDHTANRIVATPRPASTTEYQQTLDNNINHCWCVVHKYLPCTGKRRHSNSSKQLICSSCAPSGISLDRLSESQQQMILLGDLYA